MFSHLRAHAFARSVTVARPYRPRLVHDELMAHDQHPTEQRFDVSDSLSLTLTAFHIASIGFTFLVMRGCMTLTA